jgi:hypothetical protein
MSSKEEETTQCAFAMLSRDVLRLSSQPCPKTPNNDFLSKPGPFLANILLRNIRPRSCLACVPVDTLAQSARPSSVLERESEKLKCSQAHRHDIFIFQWSLCRPTKSKVPLRFLSTSLGSAAAVSAEAGLQAVDEVADDG